MRIGKKIPDDDDEEVGCFASVSSSNQDSIHSNYPSLLCLSRGDINHGNFPSLRLDLFSFSLFVHLDNFRRGFEKGGVSFPFQDTGIPTS